MREGLLFLKKKKQKNFNPWLRVGGIEGLMPAAQGKGGDVLCEWMKVFCFFFSKKKRLPAACCPMPVFD